MPNRGDRGGSKTRAHIAAVATALFLEHGFDGVTVAEIAATAGVSKVTVFSHFERKEDLLLDRLPDVVDLVRDAVRGRGEGVDPVEALRLAASALAAERHTLSGLGDGVEPFFAMVLGSPALLARVRLFGAEIEGVLVAELLADEAFTGDPALAAALIVAAYRTVAAETLHQRLTSVPVADVAADHARRLDAAFAALRRAVPAIV